MLTFHRPIYLEVASSQATSLEFRYSQQQLQITGRAVIAIRSRIAEERITPVRSAKRPA